MSPGQLDAKLGDKLYNATGATKIKLRIFLLKAAEYSGVPLSRLLTSQKGPRGPRKKRPLSSTDVVVSEKSKQKEELPIVSREKESMRVPIALAPGRLVYIELPKDWDPKKVLKKLLSLLKLSLGEEMERME